MTKETLSPIQQELLSRADSIFASIGTAVGKATDFAAVQIPDIAIQYVAYGRAYSTITIIFSLVLLLLGLWLFVGICVMDCTEDENHRIGGFFVGMPLTVVGISLMAQHMSNFMMVWFAPKIWLITELVKLAK